VATRSRYLYLAHHQGGRVVKQYLEDVPAANWVRGPRTYVPQPTLLRDVLGPRRLVMARVLLMLYRWIHAMASAVLPRHAISRLGRDATRKEHRRIGFERTSSHSFARTMADYADEFQWIRLMGWSGDELKSVPVYEEATSRDELLNLSNFGGTELPVARRTWLGARISRHSTPACLQEYYAVHVVGAPAGTATSGRLQGTDPTKPFHENAS
jgi:hypothetical protein